MKPLRVVVTPLLFILLSVGIKAQNAPGIPDIKNYNRQLYSAGSQNWGIGQDKYGILYFANNSGLLSFDGVYWRLYHSPNNTIIRSLAISSDGKIYVGGQAEIGFFAPGSNGELKYNSLNPAIPSGQEDFADVWNVELWHNDVFFRSNRKIFHLHAGKLIVSQSYNWSFMGKAGNDIFAYDDSKGLLKYDKDHWSLYLPARSLPANVQVTALLSLGQQGTLITTLSNGIFLVQHHKMAPFITKDIASLSHLNIYGAIDLHDGRIALITNMGGCILMNHAGQILQRFTQNEGIQNNNILSAFMDRDKNLWLGLDNGIDMIALNSPIKNIFPSGNTQNAGYSAQIYNHVLYLGTATGVYRTPVYGDFQIGPISMVPGTGGQAWKISVIDNHLLFGANKAAFLYENGHLSILNKRPTGFWDFLPPVHPYPYIIAGTYNGLHYFKEENGRITDTDFGADFESAKYIVRNGNTIWAMHPYKGLYKISLLPNGLPGKTDFLGRPAFLSSNHNHLFHIQNHILITSDKGIYEWDAKKQNFVRSLYFGKIFGNRNISYIKEDPMGNYWFCENGQVGVWDKSHGPAHIVYFPELTNRIQTDDNEEIYIPDSTHVLIAGEKGFFEIDYARYRNTKPSFQLLIRSVKIQNHGKDSLLFGGYYTNPTDTLPAISYSYNSISFNYASTIYGFRPDIVYSYMLKGNDPVWSPWSDKTEKNYTNLSPGKYTFLLRTYNAYSHKIITTSYSFRILPPFYRTIWAYLFYFLTVLFLFHQLYKWQKRKYRRQQIQRLRQQQQDYIQKQTEMEFQHKLELEQSEKAMATLKNERLTVELNLKNETLAANAMALVQKSELLSKIKSDLEDVKEEGTEEKDHHLKNIINTVNRELNNKEDWNKFAVYFDHVYSNFLESLKLEYPHLSAGDLKLSALLRIGLSSKEIAEILNISLKGVEIGRYRLRKKLGLPKEANLFDFFSSFKGEIPNAQKE